MKYAFVFSFHIPLVPLPFSFFEIGKGNSNYIIENTTNKGIKDSVRLLQSILTKVKKNDFKCSIYFSSTYLTFLSTHHQEILEELKVLIKKDLIELIGGTSHLSLNSMISETLFKFEINKLQQLYLKLFEKKSTVFLNTLNIYSNSIADQLSEASFKGCIVESNHWHLTGVESEGVMNAVTSPLLLLLKNYSSYSKKAEFELTISNGLGTYCDLELDTQRLNALDSNSSSTLSEAVSSCNNASFSSYNVPMPLGINNNSISSDHIISSPLQKEIITIIKRLEKAILETNKTELLTELSFFGSVDFLIRLNTNKHKSNAYQVYLIYINMLADLELRIGA